jgi:DNA polymerase/3'-5' exonuclease PolX
MAVAIGPTSGVYRSLDIRYVPEAIYIPSLLFSTGPFELNVHQRRLAIDRGLKLSEYGLIDKAGNTLDVRSEEEIFEALGMKYMSPEERETYNEG